MVKKKHPHIKLIIDFIDLWPETMPVHSLKKLPVFYVWKNIRDKYLPYADCVMTECELYQQVLGKAVCGMDVRTLYLAREDQGYKPHLHLPEDRTALCYLGSINHIIDIDTIADIIRMCRKKQPVLFHIIGDGEKKHVLVKAAEAAGAKVFCHGIVYDRKRKQQIFDSCHYGLNIMKKSVCIGLTMKSIDYFEFGLPIINNIPGDTWNAVEKYGIGLNWNSSAEVNTENSSGRKQARKFFETYLTESVFCASVRNCI